LVPAFAVVVADVVPALVELSEPPQPDAASAAVTTSKAIVVSALPIGGEYGHHGHRGLARAFCFARKAEAAVVFTRKQKSRSGHIAATLAAQQCS